MEAADGRQVAHVLRQVLAGIVLAVGVPISVATHTGVPAPEALRVPPAALQDGDLVFRRGRDAIGRIVLSHGERPRFSHVGVVVRMGNQALVAHALPETPGQTGGVRLDPLETFSSPARAADVGYFRPRVLTAEQRAQVRRYLLQSVGTPFDMRFRYSSDDSVYCTELVLKALSTAGLDLAPSLGTVRVVMLDEPAFAPDALWRSRHVEEVPAPSH